MTGNDALKALADMCSLSQLTSKALARKLVAAAAPGRYDVGRLERWSKSRLLAKLRELRQEARDSEHGGAGGSGADNESNAGDSQHGGAGGSDVDNESNAGAGAIGSDEEDELCSSDGVCSLCMEEMSSVPAGCRPDCGHAVCQDCLDRLEQHLDERKLSSEDHVKVDRECKEKCGLQHMRCAVKFPLVDCLPPRTIRIIPCLAAKVPTQHSNRDHAECARYPRACSL